MSDLDTILRLNKLMNEAQRQHIRIWNTLSPHDPRWERIMRRSLARVTRRSKAYRVSVYGYSEDADE